MALRKRIRKLFRLIANDIKVLSRKHVIITASVNIDYDGRMFHSNIGDDLNYYFLKEISVYPIMIASETLFARFLCKNYLVIGSTIAMMSNKRTIIWGAGMIDNDLPTNIQIREIKAVRGPLTQEALGKKGFNCPPCYGDPALLLPLHYRPEGITKQYEIGIIPHYADFSLLKHFGKLRDIHVIPTRGYDDWHKFIDEILQCRYIVSSSLHGLIIAEAYKVPCQWIEFGDSKGRDHFKYYDFYQSIGKEATPLHIDKNTTKEDLIAECVQWKECFINLNSLIASCPFPIKCKNDENNRYFKD